MRSGLSVPMLAVGIVVLCVGAPAWADLSLTPSSASSFQDEPSFQTADHTALLADLDGQWAPSPVSGYEKYSMDYYATGTYQGYWDAVSLSFDLGLVRREHIASAKLRFYTQQGGYISEDWHHYEIVEGAFNSMHEDTSPPSGWPGLVDLGSRDNNQVVGWIEASIPKSWITDDSFDVTLRLWNARIDKIELSMVQAPLPGAVLLGLLGFGAAGSGLLARRSGRR